MDGQGTNWRRNIADCNRLSRAHERYRQTDGRATTYSEREREFTLRLRSLKRTCKDSDRFLTSTISYAVSTEITALCCRALPSKIMLTTGKLM